MTPFLNRVRASVHNLTPKMILSNDELYTILKRRNLSIWEVFVIMGDFFKNQTWCFEIKKCHY